MKHVSPKLLRWQALSSPSAHFPFQAFSLRVSKTSLINQTGVIINSVYISPHSVDDWEEDILGQAKLDDGDSADITFSR